MSTPEQVSTAQILEAIRELKADIKSDSNAIWFQINALNQSVSTGRGAIKALVWVGGIIIAIGGLIAAFISALRHP